MKIIAIDEDSQDKRDARDYGRANPAFWARFNNKEIWVVNGDQKESIADVASLIKYAAQYKENGGNDDIEVRFRARSKELDWTGYDATKNITVAVYAPEEPIKMQDVNDVSKDLEKKIGIAAARNADVFLAPEYQYTKYLSPGKPMPISQEEHRSVATKLIELSQQYPKMLIVAGTSLWVNDLNKLQNTAFILKSGELVEHDKSTIPFGDAMLDSAMRNHLGTEASIDARTFERKISIGTKNFYDTEVNGARCRVAICSDIAFDRNETTKDKHFEIELVTSSALGQINANAHHVHQGGHVFIADRADGPAHFSGSEKKQTSLPRTDGLAIETVQVRKQLNRANLGVPAEASQPADVLAVASGSSSRTSDDDLGTKAVGARQSSSTAPQRGSELADAIDGHNAHLDQELRYSSRSSREPQPQRRLSSGGTKRASMDSSLDTERHRSQSRGRT